MSVFSGYSGQEFAARSATLSYILTNSSVLASVIHWFAAASRDEPRARYARAHDAFVSFSKKLNSKTSFSAAQLQYLKGNNGLDGETVKMGLIEQHLDILVPRFKGVVRVPVVVSSEADDSQGGDDSFEEAEAE